MGKVLESIPEPYHTVIWLVLVTGCRIGEICGLKWGAIDFDQKLVCIRLALYAHRPHKPKGHRMEHPIPLTDTEMEVLEAFHKRTPGAKDEDWLFPNPLWKPGNLCSNPELVVNGQYPMDEQHVLRVGLRKHTKLIECYLNLHLLRHWAATYWFYSKVPLNVIQARLGHGDINTTIKWYIEHLNVEEMKSAEVASELVQKLMLGAVPVDKTTGTVASFVASSVDEKEQVAVTY